DVIGAHGGTVEKFIGDAVMAVFGLHTAHGDDPERALAAALELRERLRTDPKLGERMPIRFGVNTGEVVATRDTSRGDFLITGDAVNVAARLQHAAEPWEIVCGERTVRATEAAFAFEPLADVGAKGKSAPVRSAVLRGRAVTRRRVRLPLIGRASELAQLELVAQRALGHRRPSLVSIVAPAGTGKSRLLEEFVDRLPTVAPGATVAVAQCLPYGQRLTYWPLRAVLFLLVGVADDAAPAEVRAAIARWLDGAGIDDPARVADLLASTVGASDAETSDRAALFAAWRSALEVAASRAPLVMVFEDLHWSSDSLLDLVEFVMQPRGDAAVLTIALTRPELLDRRPAYGAGRRNYTSISLDPLPDEDIASIVEHLLEASPPDVIARVVERCEGNPFYAGELVRALVERAGSLTDRDAVDRALAALPDTVQATVLARLDLLPPTERRVLQLGAVLGRSFRARGVATLAPELAAVQEAVDDLVERDMIRPAGGDRFAFRHILIREVAYQTLPRAERARLHAAAGAWLEGIAGDSDSAYAELIAFHYREAAALPSEDEADAARVRERATAWSRRAAEVALSAAALVEAKRHLEAAIALARPELLPDLYESLGDTAFSGDGAIAAYRSGLVLAREQGRGPDQQLRMLAGMLEVHMRAQGAVPERLTDEEMSALRADAARVAAEATEERAIAAYLAADAFYPFWSTGAVSEADRDEAEGKARRALAIAEPIGDERTQSAALDALGSVLAERGDYAGSRALARRRIAMRNIDLPERLDAYSMAAWMSVLLGELDEAIRVSEEGAAVSQPGQADSWTLHLLAWRAYALYLRGDWTEAIATGERMHQRWIDGGRIAAGYSLRGFIAACHAALGRGSAGPAERMRATVEAILRSFREDLPIRRAIALAAPDARPATLFDVLQLRAWSGAELLERAAALATDIGEPPTAEALDAAARFPAGSRSLVLDAQFARARAFARRDADGLADAGVMFERMNARPFVARTRVERALLLGDEAELLAGLGELERIGDVQQVERYERRRRAASLSRP
ncbi:MAG TPA: AAA family ATPase, partial [Candidatus Limnocylindria bacterium]|nr:AAA family ATPase [Candidatus Limnocylindria bacterium]